MGHEIATRITIGGYKEATVGGYTFVTTIKTNRRLVQPGHIYGFADKTALGKFLILTAPKFWLALSTPALIGKRMGRAHRERH